MPSVAVQRAVFMQCVRWGVWSPFTNPDGLDESVCVSLQGGAQPNPFGVMIYTAHTQQVKTEHLHTNTNTNIKTLVIIKTPFDPNVLVLHLESEPESGKRDF